ncbi:MAG: hypothetical protein P8M68_05115 [Aquiluna sp.]|nr:hypothetical protein [Aquiluna sp.]
MFIQAAAVSMLLMPVGLLGALTAADDELELESDSHVEQVIPPAMVDTQVDPLGSKPVDFSKVEFTTLTPADRYVSATTPLMVGLMLGTVSLIVLTLASQGKPTSDD